MIDAFPTCSDLNVMICLEGEVLIILTIQFIDDETSTEKGCLKFHSYFEGELEFKLLFDYLRIP